MIDASRVVPESLSVTALEGGNGVLEVNALTLRDGAGGPELYVALKNVGEVPACSAAVPSPPPSDWRHRELECLRGSSSRSHGEP
jgi:hypothetical protein